MLGQIVEILRVTLDHGYFRTGELPLRATPMDFQEFNEDGLRLKQRGNVISILGPAGSAPRHDPISISLIPEAALVFSVTEGADWKNIPMLDVPLGYDHVQFSSAKLSPIEQSATNKILCQLSIARAHDGLREVIVEFDTISTLWAYHIIGFTDAQKLEVVDTEQRVMFEEIETALLPNGAPARVFRSTTELRIVDRAPKTFALNEIDENGNRVLIPKLPAAGHNRRPATDPLARYPFQTDIYVNLW